MTESDSRLERLEEDMRLMKGEVKQALVDLRAIVMNADSPLGESSFLNRAPGAASPPVDRSLDRPAAEPIATAEDPVSRLPTTSTPSESKSPAQENGVGGLEDEPQSIKRLEALEAELALVLEELQDVRDGKQRAAEHGRILSVDDDPRIRETLQRGLTRSNYECVGVGDAEQAAKALEDEDFDVVLLDIGMPGLSGKDYLPKLKAEYPDIGVIMLSGKDDMSTAIWCMREGASDYVAKPIDLREVTIRIRGALSHRRLLLEKRESQANLELMAHELDKRLEGRKLELAEVEEYLENTWTGRGLQIPEAYGNVKKILFSFGSELARLSHLAKTGIEPEAQRSASE